MSEVKRPIKKKKMLFSPCSEEQRILLMDETTDVILTGG